MADLNTCWKTTKDYVLANLGYPTISVELTDGQIEVCIREALEKYFEYRTPCLKHHYFTLKRGQDIYDLPPDAIHQGEQGVHRIKAVIYRPSNFEQFQYYFQYTLYNYKPVNIANIHMMFQNLETFKYVTGAEINWEIINGNQIRIAPVPRDKQEDACLVYSTNSPDSELDQNPWIWKATFALSMQIVGRVRNKFSIPSPTGGELNLAGAELISEGRERFTELVQHLKDTQEPMPFLVG